MPVTFMRKLPLDRRAHPHRDERQAPLLRVNEDDHQYRREAIDSLFQSAKQALENGDVGSAVAAIEEARGLTDGPLKNHELAKSLIEVGEWNAALMLMPEFADSTVWIELAASQLLDGDLDGYRKRCREILSLYGESTSKEDSERLLRSCLMTPDFFDRDLVKSLSDTAASWTDEEGVVVVGLLAKGKAEFRLGHFESAIDWLDRCVTRVDQLDERDLRSHRPIRATARLLLAMCHDRLGDPGQSKDAVGGSGIDCQRV